YRWRTFAERTETGVIGDPSKASPEKGEKLLAAAAEAVAGLILRDDLWRESR
ncbi:MAG: creatininase family protein, partial [Alphaproteobacteria bacterium]